MSDETQYSPPDAEDFRVEAVEKEPSSIARELVQVLDRRFPDRSTELRAQHEAILNRVPANFVIELRAHLHDVEHKQEARRQRGLEADPPLAEVDDPIRLERGRLIGEVFERLIQYDDELAPSQHPVAAELLQLLEDADRYDLGEDMEGGRNPDAVGVIVDARGNIVIQEIQEAKTSRYLGDRAVDQFEKFEAHVERMVHVVNALGEAGGARGFKHFGLDALGDKYAAVQPLKGDFVEKADDFRRVLVVPADRPDNVEGLFREPNENDRKYREHPDLYEPDRLAHKALVAKAKKALAGVEIKHAAFDGAELAALVDFLYEKIQEEERASAAANAAKDEAAE